MDKVKVFQIMTEAGPIGKELVRVLEAKGIPTTIWVIAMIMSLLSIELDGQQVNDDFIIGIIRTVYRVQQEADKVDNQDKKSSN